MQNQTIQKTFITALTLAAAVMALTACSSTANADEYSRIDRLADRIQRKSLSLLKETTHYRYTPQYRSLVSQTSMLNQAAIHVHEVAHLSGDLYHLENDLRQMDRCFQRLEDLFDRTERRASSGNGRIYGPTGRVKGLLNSIDNSVKQIRREVGRLQQRFETRQQSYAAQRPVYIAPRPTYVTPEPIYVAPKAVYRPQINSCPGMGRRPSASGISIGGGSSRLTFNF